MFGSFYNEEMASITYQNKSNEIATNGLSMPVMSFSPYKSQFLVPEEDRFLTWGINKQAVNVEYPHYFDVFDLKHKATGSFGLCAIAYNKPISSSNFLLNVGNFESTGSSITSQVGVVATNSVSKIIAAEVNLVNTMKVIGTIDDIVAIKNPFSPKSEYYNSLRRDLFPNRYDEQFANDCFVYYGSKTNQGFPIGPTMPLYLTKHNGVCVSGFKTIKDIMPTLFNLNTIIDQSSSTMDNKPLSFSLGIDKTDTFEDHIITEKNSIIAGTSVSITYFIDTLNVTYEAYHTNSIFNSYNSSREVNLLAVAPYGTAPAPLLLSMGTPGEGQYQGTSFLVAFDYNVVDVINV